MAICKDAELEPRDDFYNKHKKTISKNFDFKNTNYNSVFW